MYTTENEIFQQYEALERTYNGIQRQFADLKSLFAGSAFRRIIFIGCGSSYYLAKSAALSANLRQDIPALALPAGDLLLNFEQYQALLAGSVLVSLSRSGSTSEVIMAVQKAKEQLHTPCISICAKENAPLANTAILNLEIPWAYDNSVCQTRCVSNLYLAALMLVACLADDSRLLQSCKEAIADGPAFLHMYKEPLQAMAELAWNQVVILADAELAGLAEEGALAFTEIALVPSRFHHFLDVRHGPVVLIDERTLVVAALSGNDTAQQDSLLHNLQSKGATLVVLSDRENGVPMANCSVTVAEGRDFAANGLPFIFLPQALSLYKALKNNINPDTPEGLDAWIKL